MSHVPQPPSNQAPMRRHPLSPGPYILYKRGCVGHGPASHLCGVFQNDAYVGTRMSVMVDNCDAQVFAPLTSYRVQRFRFAKAALPRFAKWSRANHEKSGHAPKCR
ncbi:MAG: hypothetical protein JWP25_8330 [Bradyrhizobium sp.]|nr:hypothetical protein [Bradyrhizobium sp.]